MDENLEAMGSMIPRPSTGGVAGLLDRLKGKCITVRTVSGEEITGFNRGVQDGVLRLFVSGGLIFVVIDKIELFFQSGGC